MQIAIASLGKRINRYEERHKYTRKVLGQLKDSAALVAYLKT